MKNFVIVGTYRTGSSAIAESIGLSPQVICGWEWTRATPCWSNIKVAKTARSGDFSYLKQHHQNHMKQIFSHNASWLGFRRLFSSSANWIIHPRFSPALQCERLEGHLRWLQGARDIHVIHIVRRKRGLSPGLNPLSFWFITQ
jgi:hypothetical protein